MCRDTPAIRNLSRASYDLHVQLAKQLNGQRNYGFRHVSPFAISFNEVQGSGVWGTHERAKWSTEDGGHLEEVLSDEEKNEEEEDWDEEDRELKNNNLHFAVEDGSDLLLSPQQLEQEEVEVVMDDKRSYFSSLADPPLDEHYTNHSSPHQTLPACNDTSALEMKEIPSNEQEVQGTKTEINTSSTDPPPHLQNSFYHDDDGSIIDSVINDVMQSVFSTPKVDISGQQRVSSPLQPHFAPPLPTTTGTLGSAASVKYSGLEFPFAAGIGDGSVSTIPTGSTSSLCSNMIETLSYASSFASISTSSSSSSLSSRTNSPAEKMYTSCSSAATTSSTALASSFINQDVNFSLNDYHYNNCSTSASFYSSSSSISALPLMMSGDGGGTVIRDSLSFFVRDAAYCGGGGGIDPNCLSSSSTPSSVNSSSASSPNTKGLGGNNSNANSPNSPHGSIEVLPTQHARPPPQALHNSTTTTTTTSSLSASSSSASSLRTTIKGSSSKIPCWLDESLIKRSNALGTIDEAAQCHPLYFTRKLVRESGARIIFGTAVDTIVVQEKVKSVIIKVSSSFGGSAAADKKNNHNTSSSSCYSPPPPPPFKEKLVRLDCDEVILACGPWTAETLESMNLDIIGEFKGHLANSVVLSTPCDTVASKMSQAIFGDIRVGK